MRIVLQRVKQSAVSIDGACHGAIEKGFLALVGFCPTDTEAVLPKLIDKLVHLRVFEDENGKMNRSLLDIGGSVLSVSQFTLYADCRKGRRPSFTGAARPELAEPLYEAFNARLLEAGRARGNRCLRRRHAGVACKRRAGDDPFGQQRTLTYKKKELSRGVSPCESSFCICWFI